MISFAPLALLRSLARGTLVVLGIGSLSALFLALVELTVGSPEVALDDLTVLGIYLLVAYPWWLVVRLRDEARLLLPALAAFVTFGLAMGGGSLSGMIVSALAAALLVAERRRRAIAR